MLIIGDTGASTAALLCVIRARLIRRHSTGRKRFLVSVVVSQMSRVMSVHDSTDAAGSNGHLVPVSATENNGNVFTYPLAKSITEP